MSVESRRQYETKKKILKDTYLRELREINERLSDVVLKYEEGLERRGYE